MTEYLPNPEKGLPYTKAARARLYRGLALLLARLPRGADTVLRIVRQRSGSKEDVGVALWALAQAGVELREQKKALRRMMRPPKRRRRK